MGFHIFRPVASFFLTLNVCAVANGLSGFVASVSAGAFYLDYTALARPKGGKTFTTMAWRHSIYIAIRVIFSFSD